MSAEEARRPRPGRTLTLTRGRTGTKQTTLRRRLGSHAACLPSSRGHPRRPATTKETPTGLWLVLRRPHPRRRAAAKEATSTGLRLWLRLRLGLLVRRHRRVAEEATTAGLRLILRRLRARGSATTKEQSTAGWLTASITSAEEARAGVLA